MKELTEFFLFFKLFLQLHNSIFLVLHVPLDDVLFLVKLVSLHLHVSADPRDQLLLLLLHLGPVCGQLLVELGCVLILQLLLQLFLLGGCIELHLALGDCCGLLGGLQICLESLHLLLQAVVGLLDLSQLVPQLAQLDRQLLIRPQVLLVLEHLLPIVLHDHLELDLELVALAPLPPE